jgi:PPOX class probable F420-dependent enzyme
MTDENIRIPDSHAELLHAPWATMATIDDHGRPQLSQVVFLWEDGRIRVSLNETRWKVRYLRRRPAVGILIPDPGNPLRTLEIRGDATLADDPDKAFAARAGAKYGQDFTVHDAPGDQRVVVEVRPVVVHAVDLGG